jgi:hypothetical protein
LSSSSSSLPSSFHSCPSYSIINSSPCLLWTWPKIEIRSTPKKGYGLFATETLFANTAIPYFGRETTTLDLNSTYVMLNSKGKYLDGNPEIDFAYTHVPVPASDPALNPAHNPGINCNYRFNSGLNSDANRLPDKSIKIGGRGLYIGAFVNEPDLKTAANSTLCTFSGHCWYITCRTIAVGEEICARYGSTYHSGTHNKYRPGRKGKDILPIYKRNLIKMYQNLIKTNPIF